MRVCMRVYMRVYACVYEKAPPLRAWSVGCGLLSNVGDAVTLVVS